MALYVLGDLHLCLGAPKPMDIFGGAWVGYMEKLRQGLSILTPEDTTVLLGDLSWALGLDASKPDFDFINAIPGKKILVKGNHDYWWATNAKFQKFCAANGYSGMELLHNTHFEYNGVALCGTRGWFFEEDRSGQHDEKVFRRELCRLEVSLKSAGDLPKIAFLHYPPKYRGYDCDEILELLHHYDVRKCYYGHLHGPSQKLAMQGLWDGIDYHMVSADAVNFVPQKVMD